MLKIKLVKTGKKNAPTFRVSVGEGKRVVEYLGVYNPQQTPALLEVDKDKISSWVKKGAHLTPAVDQILKGKYTFKRYNPHPAESAGEVPAETAPAKEAEAPAPDKAEAPIVEEAKTEAVEEKSAPEAPAA